LDAVPGCDRYPPSSQVGPHRLPLQLPQTPGQPGTGTRRLREERLRGYLDHRAVVAPRSQAPDGVDPPRIDEPRHGHPETASRQGARREHVDRLDRGRRIALRLDEGVDEPIELGSAPTRPDPPKDAPEVDETHPVVEPDVTPD